MFGGRVQRQHPQLRDTPWSQLHFSHAEWTFQQYCAPACRAITTQDWCKAHSPVFYQICWIFTVTTGSELRGLQHMFVLSTGLCWALQKFGIAETIGPRRVSQSHMGGAAARCRNISWNLWSCVLPPRDTASKHLCCGNSECSD